MTSNDSISSTETSPTDAGTDKSADGLAFSDLGLSEALLATLKTAGYISPTPIQAKAIPHVLEGSDLLGCAQTGTGKTAAFALPIIELMEQRGPIGGRYRQIQTLVLAPTRELAAQIGDSFRKYAGRRGPRIMVVFGGVSKRMQVQTLRRGIDILVATPGRLMDLMNDGEVDLSEVLTFILDEADRMLDMGFVDDVRRISKALPVRRQTLLFSATMPKEIEDLAKKLTKDAVRVAVDPISSVRAPIIQSIYFVEKNQKTPLLIELINTLDINRGLVFSRTKHGANKLVTKLGNAGIRAAAIHGNKSQAARVKALNDFKSGKVNIVVATDIAARGIDVKDLTHVFNFDLPNEPESYVHRIGRTGRAGAGGVAISFCSTHERSDLRKIERLTNQRISVEKNPEGLPEGVVGEPEPRGGGRRGGRGGGRRNSSGGGRGRPSGGARGRSADRQGRSHYASSRGRSGNRSSSRDD